MVLPGQREVAFLRSPVAHGIIRGIKKPPNSEGRVFVREDLAEAKDIVAPSTLPTYKISGQPPLAQGKVRFVGEPVVMCVAKTRAEAEDLAELVVLDIEELPALVDSETARFEKDNRVHEEWDDNLFLTLARRPAVLELFLEWVRFVYSDASRLSPKLVELCRVRSAVQNQCVH